MTTKKTSMRTHTCGDLTAKDIGGTVTLCGWMDVKRNHGGVVFMNLRDLYGITQIVVRPESPVFKPTDELKSEYALKITGKVVPRPPESLNTKIATGEIEVEASDLEILNTSQPLPFDLGEHAGVLEETRLKHRYLDLRRRKMAHNLVLRSRVAGIARAYLSSLDFNEIETPLLTRSTPEGARDFVVPSRANPGKFYALPQSPQVFKQVLMASGLDRYFQLARNFRDEELRSDRQPEHTQIDIEMSFVTEADIAAVVEGMMSRIFSSIGDTLDAPFPEMEYSDAMSRYGSDKPDLRYGLEIADVSEIFRDSGFKVFSGAIKSGGHVSALTMSGAGISRSLIDRLEETLKKQNAKGLPWIRWSDPAKPESPIVKFFTPEEMEALRKQLDIKPGQLTFFGVGAGYAPFIHMGILRTEFISDKKLAECAGLEKPAKKWAFLWVRHFPLLEKDAQTGRWTFTHNPFTAPLPEETAKLDTDPGNVRSCQYDLVLNGVELGSGSARNHTRAMQEKIFGLMGYSKEEIAEKFGMLVNALDFGAPPHAGIGIGFDRLVGIICGTDSIRDVIAFPKTASGACPLSESPAPLDEAQLKELHLRITP
ncbi:MAG TPA: aspartate--tRNA ligase [Elusimicrobia bacterium]|nr:aspartate--tRNA ligase [Elusimicrobiota bacterium]